MLTGLFAIGLGVFLIVLNSIISKKEEDDLEAYVQSQLTRSRSGNKMKMKIQFSLIILKISKTCGKRLKESEN